MGSKNKIHPADKALFRATVGPVKRLTQENAIHHPTRPKPQPKQSQNDDQNVLNEMMSLEYDEFTVETGDELLYIRPGFQQRKLTRLRRGQYSIEAELDLHGMTILTAHEALIHFLRDCQNSGTHCIRIIHGKGHGSKHRKPILKNKVNNWLRQRDEVLAFCSAPAADGGTGALYALLKRC